MTPRLRGEGAPSTDVLVAGAAQRAIGSLLSELEDGEDSTLYDALVLQTLRELAQRSARAAGLPLANLGRGRLFASALAEPVLNERLVAALEADAALPAPNAGELGRIYEALIAFGVEAGPDGRRKLVRVGHRKRTGSFYTPP